jgi:tRNA nucleotidyltransferase/poly(A) polymerase
MLDQARNVLAGEEAWIVGGAVRDELLGRPLVDLDIACRDPRAAAQAYAEVARGALFPLSERHGAWRVALADARTVDFTPLRDGIESDLATRDFTINAIARPLAGEGDVDPFGGRADLEARTIRAVGDEVFRDDPLRLLRAVRLEDELEFRLAPETERLVHRDAELVTRPAGERTLSELKRLSASGFRRLEELGLLESLGGSTLRLAGALDDPDYRLVAVFEKNLERLPVSNELRRFARTLLRAERPQDDSARSLHRFRRDTEPWALEALAFVGAPEYADAVRAAREGDPRAPLVRGDELGLPPGPEIGRILELIEEERASGTVSTREEALELARRRAR